MNEIKVKVNFKNRQCFVSGVNLTSGDYNSTKIIFSFDKLDGQKIFEMKNPAGEIVFVQEIKNDEIILVGQADVTAEHDNKQYIKYLDLSENTYWYNSEEQKLYDLEWTEVEDFNLDNYIKQTEDASIFTESGKYVFEISLYDGDSKLTSACNYIPVKQEEIVINNEIVKPYLPIFDELIKQVNKSINEANNLDIDVVVEENNTVIEITKKDGSKKSTTVSGSSGEDTVSDVKVDGKSIVENKIANIDLTGKVDKVNGKGLSTNDYTEEDKNKLANIEAGAQKNKVNSVNNQTGNVTINVPTKTSDLNNDSGFITDYTETDPTVPDHVKNIKLSDIENWNNKSDFSGNYDDLNNKPTIPTVPTNISAFTNDKGYITKDVSDLTNYYDKTYINKTIGDIESLLGGI